jgi:predicted nucleic acid-binding protein
MNVFAETNFILELVFLQEQSASCEKIIELSAEGKIQLIIPSYSFVEPYEKLHRQKVKRQEIQRELDSEIRNLSRSEGYEGQIRSMTDLDTLLTKSVTEEQNRFNHYKTRLLQISQVIPLDPNILSTGHKFETTFSLRGPDAIILASVVAYLKNEHNNESCFLNRNFKDFDIPDIITELTELNCRMIPNFDGGLNIIQRHLLSNRDIHEI